MSAINLPELAACMCALGDDVLAAQVYSLAIAARESTDPNTIAESVKCWCLDETTLEAIEAYAANQVSGYNVESLEDDLACYECVSPLGLEWIFLFLACALASETSDCTPILDEAGNPILDESGNVVCAESL